MKKIIYYITDHGKGHASRSISVIRELQKHDIDVTVRNSNSIKFIQNSIPGINVLSSKTDVGISVKNDLLSIDKDKSISKTIEKIYNEHNKNFKFYFTNGGDKKINNIPEREICIKLGIEMIDGLGEKIQSSSWLLNKL